MFTSINAPTDQESMPVGLRARGHLTAILMALGLAACGSDSPTTPSNPGGGGGSPVSLVTLAVAPPSVVGGTSATVTATLSSAAPTGGAAVTLTSSHAAAAGGTLTVAAGATSGTATIATTAVATAATVTISGTYAGGAARTTELTVTPPALQAAFSVTSATRPAGQNQDVCVIASPSGDLDCEFDGSASTNARTWEWTYIVGQQARNVSLDAPRMRPATDCAFLGTPAAGVQFVPLEVRLRVRDAAGAQSAERINRDIRILPSQGYCGWP